MGYWMGLLSEPCNGTLGGEFLVESPEGFFLAGVSENGEVAVDEGELGVGNVDVEGAFDDAFVKNNIVDFHNRLDFVGDFCSGISV